MQRTRAYLATLFLGFAGSAFYLTAQPNTVKKIADGVWFREGDLKGEGHCNNVVIEMKDYLIVVDANFPSGAKALIADIKKISTKPVKYVFDTHHHGDHAYGNPIWTKMGATTLAYVGVAEEMKRYEPARWKEASKERKDVGELKLATAEPPKQTFSTPNFKLSDGARTVEFHFFGWAHTRGDGFVFLPKEKIICTGDAVVNGPYNFTGDGNVGNWPNVVKNAQKMNAATVLPAHGPHGGPEILAGELAFMTELNKAVKMAKASGKKVEDIVKMEKGKPVSTSLKLPDSVKNWVGDFFPAQVYDAYQEQSMGKPRGDLKL